MQTLSSSSDRTKMSASLILLVLGQANNYSAVFNISSISPNLTMTIVPEVSSTPAPEANSTYAPATSSTSAPEANSTYAPAANSTCAPEASPAPTRDDYTYTPGMGVYKVHTKAVSWNKAWQICRNEGAQLAIINSYAESKLIVELLKKAGPSEGGNDPSHAHIGFHDLYVNGEWVTIDGQSLIQAGYAEWNHNEPNKLSGGEHCGSVHEKTGQLNDTNCNTKTCRFICELPYGQPQAPSTYNGTCSAS